MVTWQTLPRHPAWCGSVRVKGPAGPSFSSSSFPPEPEPLLAANATAPTVPAKIWSFWPGKVGKSLPSREGTPPLYFDFHRVIC